MMSKFHPDSLTDEQCLSGVSWETYNELYRVATDLAEIVGNTWDYPYPCAELENFLNSEVEDE